MPHLDIVILGLSITSSWGNGHATTYRGLVRELSARGHRVLFLERDKPWYASHRDLAHPPFGRTELYTGIEDLKSRFAQEIRDADLVIVGSYVPEGVAAGEWVTRTTRGIAAFYDIDTPVTLGKLDRGDTEYLSPSLLPRYQLYLSFTGGPTLEKLEREYGAQMARPLYCSLDPTVYHPERRRATWDMGFMGTYSSDRQPALEKLLFRPARALEHRRFVAAGSLFPEQIQWPENVERIDHLPPAGHRAFYTGQRFTLNVTRADMRRAGYSPSVRLFEASACATPIISDYWDGLEDFFKADKEILVARSADDVLCYLREMSDTERRAIGENAHRRVMAEHTAAHRAQELERYAYEALGQKAEYAYIVPLEDGSALRAT